jgi:hypothetical protein
VAAQVIQKSAQKQIGQFLGYPNEVTRLEQRCFQLQAFDLFRYYPMRNFPFLANSLTVSIANR